MDTELRVKRFRYCADPLFIAAIVFYVLNRLILRPSFGHELPFLRTHLNDLLLVPFWLPPTLLLQRLLRMRVCDIFPTATEILVHVALWSLLFEWLAPASGLFPATTADPFDVVAYSAGGVMAWMGWHHQWVPASAIPHQASETL